jgi:hypothetical protein
MAIIADQINVGPVAPLPVVKSDLQKLRESFADPSDVKVINNLSYKIGVIDPFKVRKKRSIEELILINELRQNSKENAVFKEGDLLTFKQARDAARAGIEIEEIAEEDQPDWTIERVVKGSFNKLRGKIEGVDIIDSYDTETPIFVVERSVTDFDNVRSNSLNSVNDNVFVSAEQANIDAESKINERILNNTGGPTRSSVVKKRKLESIKESSLIEYRKSAFTSDMLSSSKD